MKCDCKYKSGIIEMDATCEDCHHNKRGAGYFFKDSKCEDCIVRIDFEGSKCDAVHESNKVSRMMVDCKYCPECGRKL